MLLAWKRSTSHSEFGDHRMLRGSTFDLRILNYERRLGDPLHSKSAIRRFDSRFSWLSLRLPNLWIQDEGHTIIQNSPFADSDLKYLLDHFLNSELSFRPSSSDARNATSGYTSIRPTLCSSVCSSTCFFTLRHCSGPTSTRPGSLDGLLGDRDLPSREWLVNSKLKNYGVLTDTMHHCATSMAEPFVKPHNTNHRKDQAKQPTNES